MARRGKNESEDPPDDASIGRSVGRALVNGLIVLVSLGVIVGWAWTGIYELQPGESAVILQFGARSRIVVDEGLHWHYPAPIETLEIVNVSEVRQESFGLRTTQPPRPRDAQPADDETPVAGESTTSFENQMQTADNNIVNLGYVLKYEIDDAFAYLYGMANPEQTLLDATRSAVREVVGQMNVDDVLYTRRNEIETRSRKVLNERLSEYFGVMEAGSAFSVRSIELQVVSPPAQVQEAFDEIIAAGQDEERAISQARGDAKEITERANAQAIEFEQSSLAYKESKVLEAKGRAARFDALLVEYQLAPEVTRRRLYLETMEEILPEVDKMVIEPGSATLVPFLSMGQGAMPALPAPPPSSAPQPPPAPEKGADQ